MNSSREVDAYSNALTKKVVNDNEREENYVIIRTILIITIMVRRRKVRTSWSAQQ